MFTEIPGEKIMSFLPGYDSINDIKEVQVNNGILVTTLLSSRVEFAELDLARDLLIFLSEFHLNEDIFRNGWKLHYMFPVKVK